MDFDERILEAADQFYQAAKLCGGHCDEAGEPEDWLVFPEIVNYAFAAELALKGLHWVHLGKPPHGHDLEQLCVNLPPMLVAEMAAHTFTPQALFRWRLHDVRSAFQDWRYALEKEELGLAIGFLSNLAAAAIYALRRDAPAPSKERPSNNGAAVANEADEKDRPYLLFADERATTADRPASAPALALWGQLWAQRARASQAIVPRGTAA